MGEREHLTIGEFERWRANHDAKIDKLVTYFEEDRAKQGQVNLEQERRITTLETHREHAILGIGVFTTIIGSVVGGITGWLFGR